MFIGGESQAQAVEATPSALRSYADNGGEPGAILLATTGTLTKSVVNTGSGFDPVNFYSSDLASTFSAAAGTRYWLSIFNGASDASWLWLAANNAGNGAVQQESGSSTWPVVNTDLAYQLTSTVPEPGTLALLGFGLAGLAASRRRKE